MTIDRPTGHDPVASPARGGGPGWGPDWARRLWSLAETRTPAVQVTLAATKGSAPREPGARIVVTVDQLHGTIGGGHLEFKAVDIARRLLAGDQVEPLQRFPLGAALGQCCGGAVELLFEPVTTRADWLDTLARLGAHDPDTARVVVTRVRSDAASSKLIVEPAAALGSLGDATLDAQACTHARALLASRAGTQLHTLRLADRGETCLFDPIHPCDWRFVLFGAGHVGQALVRALADLPCEITWVDTRDAVFPSPLPANVRAVATDTPDAEIDAAPRHAWFVVMTHSHALDQDLAERILARGDFAWFGLIGSATKRRLFEQRLGAKGLTTQQLATMTCPIGIDGIRDKRPAAIALAVAAQVLRLKETGSGLRSVPCNREGVHTAR